MASLAHLWVLWTLLGQLPIGGHTAATGDGLQRPGGEIMVVGPGALMRDSGVSLGEGYVRIGVGFRCYGAQPCSLPIPGGQASLGS